MYLIISGGEASGSELVDDAHRSEQAKRHLLLVRERSLCRQQEVEKLSISECAEQVAGSLELGHEDGPRNDLPAEILPGDFLQDGQPDQPHRDVCP